MFHLLNESDPPLAGLGARTETMGITRCTPYRPTVGPVLGRCAKREESIMPAVSDPEPENGGPLTEGELRSIDAY